MINFSQLKQVNDDENHLATINGSCQLNWLKYTQKNYVKYNILDLQA